MFSKNVKCNKCGFTGTSAELIRMLVTGNEEFKNEVFVKYEDGYDSLVYEEALCCPKCESDHDVFDIYYVVCSDNGYWNFETETWVKNIRDATLSLDFTEKTLLEVKLPAPNMRLKACS